MTNATTTEPLAIPSMNPDREILTYSALAKFRNCRRSFKHRYVDGLRSREKSEALWIGAAFHDALHISHIERKSGKSRAEALQASLLWLDRGVLLGASSDPARQGSYDLLHAMLRNYEARWGTPREGDSLGDHNLEEVAAELAFVVPIVNPETGRGSLTFQLAGKIDGLVRFEGKLFIKETKTASSIDFEYISKLWADFQSQLYAAAISRSRGERVHGVIYDVTAKTRTVRAKGETAFDFEERLAGYKTEKTRALHIEKGAKKAETEFEFSARLDEWYAQPDKFIRELIYFDQNTLENVESEVWELTQQILDARRRDKWGQNTTQCYAFGSCPYTAICRNNGKLDPTIEGFFEVVPPHEELKSVLPAGYIPTSDLSAELERIERGEQPSGYSMPFPIDPFALF